MLDVDSSSDLLQPTVDCVFKKIIGSDPSICLAVICAVLKWDPSTIRFDKFQDKDLVPFYPDKKRAALDVLVTLQDGTSVHIEMQTSTQTHYGKRALFYWAHKYASQLSQGGHYGSLKKHISIHILTETYFKSYSDVHNEMAIVHLKSKTLDEKFSDFNLHFIELSKFDNQWIEHENLSHWCLFFKDPAMVKDKLNQDEQIKKAYKELEKLSADPNERAYYDARKKELMDIESALHDGKAQARAEGKAEGLAEGEAKGLAEGEAKGELKIIQKLLTNGYSIEEVSEMTQMSVEQIRQLLLGS